jgi:chemotaxis protein CheD
MLTNERSEAAKNFMVGMADLMISQDQSFVLCTFPLGACLGIAIYDPVLKVGGVLHSMLPDSSIDPKRAAARPGMFLDTGLALLLEYAGNLKVKKENLLVYVAGGSQVMDETGCFNIGERNYAVLTGLLAHHGIKIHAEDVGGLTNRTMQLTVETGEVRLKFSGQAKMKILCKPSTIT